MMSSSYGTKRSRLFTKTLLQAMNTCDITKNSRNGLKSNMAKQRSQKTKLENSLPLTSIKARVPES